MIKIMLLIKRLAGVTPDAFRSHYEEVHVPLAFELFPMMAWHQRNYPDTTGMAGMPEPGVDCVTEIAFADEHAFQIFLEARQDADIL